MTIDRKIAFVCGLHKSGTSLLARILRDHPNISGHQGTGVPEDEGQHLQSIYEPAYVYGGPGRFGFDERSYLTEKSSLVSSDAAHKLFSEWSRYWDLGADLLLEKSPPNLVRTRFLQALFPNSYFIIITRHPIAVACATRKWSKTDLRSLIKHWLVCHERFEADRPYLHRTLSVRYEDLTADPGKLLRQIGAFLEVEDIPVSHEVDSSINRKYFDEWKMERSGVSGKLASLYEIARYERRIARFNYSLKL
jgi:hypothetical protein